MRTKEKQAFWHLTKACKKLGITLEEYYQLRDLQNDVCAICGRPPIGKSRLSIDHCHISNVVRGLLCDPCNLAIGYLQDNPDLCFKAGEYLMTQGVPTRA